MATPVARYTGLRRCSKIGGNSRSANRSVLYPGRRSDVAIIHPGPVVAHDVRHRPVCLRSARPSSARWESKTRVGLRRWPGPQRRIRGSSAASPPTVSGWRFGLWCSRGFLSRGRIRSLALNQVRIPFAAARFLGEQVNAMRWLGVVLIVGGVFLASRGGGHAPSAAANVDGARKASD